MSPPKVSVLMPVFNGERYLRDAVASILGQTFQDFELLIINDGSRDGSREIIESLQDSRVVPVDNGENLGLIATLNKGLNLARGDYIARMDCDDLSRPERLEKQVAFLDAHPDVALCGTWIRKFGIRRDKVCRYHTDPLLLACGLLFDSVLAHPTVMLRKRMFTDNGLFYDVAYKHAEDYELWVRASKRHRLGTVAEVLLDYRVHPAQISSAFNADQLESAGRVRLSLLKDIGLVPDAEQFEIHQRLGNYLVNGDRHFFEKADEWLCTLKDANDRCKVYPEPYFSAVLTERLVTLLKKMLEQKVLPKGMVLAPRLFRKTGLGWGFVARFFSQSQRGEFIPHNA
jgi:glycosyltransferase involved in cell wall biosynthesis